VGYKVRTRLTLLLALLPFLALARPQTAQAEPDEAQAGEEADAPEQEAQAAAVQQPQTPAPARASKGPALGEDDLQPYFTGAAKKARAALDAGRASQALQLLPARPKDAPTRWLRAQALLAAGRCAEAQPELEKLAALNGALRDRALFEAGQCAEQRHDATAALRLYRAVPQSSVDAGDAYLAAARLLRGRLPPQQAAEETEEVLAPLLAMSVRGDPAAAHLVAGDAFAAAGNADRAREHYRTAWLDWPLSPASFSARERAHALGGGPPIAPGRFVQRIEMLVEGGALRTAIAEASALKLPPLCAGGCPGDRSPGGLLKAALQLLGALPPSHKPTAADVARAPQHPADPLVCRARLAEGRAHRKLRQYAQARAVLAPVVLRCQDAEVRAPALFILAQLESLSGQDAEPLWLALATHFPRSSLADDALFQAAVARRQLGDVEGERALLERLVREQPDGDLTGEALFRLFWSHQAQGRPRAGLRWLNELAGRPGPDGAEQERARYWRARALLERQPSETAAARAKAEAIAHEDLLWLARERPLTYHGLLARSRMAEIAGERERELEEAEARRMAALSGRKRRPLHLGPLEHDPHLHSAVQYLRLLQPKDAARELAAVDRRVAVAAGEAGHEVLTLIADLHFRAGDLRSAHNVVRGDLRSLLRHPSSALAVRAALLAYPLAFRPEIAEVSARSSFPADLLQALMREESALDPRAVSSAGALGLTQLMPRTAREVAHRLGLRGYTTARLYEPALNIRIGGTYFGQLYAHFKNAALALASYNAGPGNVGSWIKQRGELPLDAFVEEIPLDETRGYVKRCLRSFAAYRYLYGTGPSRVPRVGQALAAAQAIRASR
jgi:soluble lytic murein transglycosylase